MPFNLKQFQKAKFDPRTETVPVPALSGFFGPGETPAFVIRGLTGEEMARCNEAQAKGRNLTAVVEALSGNGHAEKVHALRESLGLSDDNLPEDLARRIEILARGCVEPTLDQQAAAKLFKVCPVDGYNLTNKIQLLSGQGMRLGEYKPSGKTPASKPPCTSVTPEGACSTS